MYQQRHYAIFSITELNNVNFDQVLETSADTVRKSIDQSRTFVKWDSEEIPSSIQALTTVEGYYNHEEMLNILSGPDWSSPSTDI